MTKKVTYSLKFKLIVLISSLLLVAIGFYTLFAADLFQKDKEAYVFENALSGLDQFQTSLENYDRQLSQYSEVLNRLYLNPKDHSLISQFIQDTPDLLAVSLYQVASEEEAELAPVYSYAKESFLTQMVLDQKEFDEIISQELYSHLRSPSLRPEILLGPFSSLQSQLQNQSAHGLYVAAQSKQAMVLFLFFDLDHLAKPFQQQRIFDYAIRDKNAHIIPIVTHHENNQTSLRNFFLEAFSKNTGIQQQGVISVRNEAEQDYLLAFTTSASTQLEFISLIPKKMAFAATTYLIQQSLLVALIVLSLAVIIGILFSKSLTNPLEVLYQATQKMSQGDFQTRVQLQGSDEIHSLGNSFNEMSEKILIYMEEMKEKSRLENELAVAKLVQDSFFPPNDIKTASLHLHSFYTPATECGGDWWGTLERQDQSLIILADATGHGVPAAFLTATVYSCMQTLDQMTGDSPTFLHGPAQILELLNKTVCSVGKDILLTALVLIIDKKTGQLTYSNASHLDPFILRVPAGETANKQHFIPLMEAKGPRLGHKNTANYQESHFSLHTGDKLIIWTDGITEATDLEGKEWGMRKFLQSLLSSPELKPQFIRDKVLEDLKSYHGERPFEDDVTFVCSEWIN